MVLLNFIKFIIYFEADKEEKNWQMKERSSNLISFVYDE